MDYFSCIVILLKLHNWNWIIDIDIGVAKVIWKYWNWFNYWRSFCQYWNWNQYGKMDCENIGLHIDIDKHLKIKNN